MTVISATGVMAQNNTTEIQIKTAIMAAPQAQRADASVYGYTDKNDFVLKLKKALVLLQCLSIKYQLRL